jgi:hypothetical protein
VISISPVFVDECKNNIVMTAGNGIKNHGCYDTLIATIGNGFSHGDIVQ